MSASPNKKSRTKILVISLLVTLAVFVIDILTLLGVAIGVLYVLVIIISLWLDESRYVYMFAIICSLLTAAGYFLSPDGGEFWSVVANRFMAIFVIWTTAIIAIKWRASEQQLINYVKDAEKEQEKKNIYYATMSSAQHITNNLLNGLKLVEMEIKEHPKFNSEVTYLFDGMLDEANNLMKKLSSVEHIDAESIKKSVTSTKRKI
ncbi:MAG: hypothetical protein PVG20_04115 [Thioalkalispiraceae bacterium]